MTRATRAPIHPSMTLATDVAEPGFPGAGLPGTDLGQLRRLAKLWLRRGAGRRSRGPGSACGAGIHGARSSPLGPRSSDWRTPSSAWPDRTGSRAGPGFVSTCGMSTAGAAIRTASTCDRSGRRAAPAGLPHLRRRRADPAGTGRRAAGARIPGWPARTSSPRQPPVPWPTWSGSSPTTRRVSRAEGGPHRWTPAALPVLRPAAGRATRPVHRGRCARLLLDAGADSDAGFLWEGLAPPFTCLTGAFGGGEDRANQPPHQHAPRWPGCCSRPAPTRTTARPCTTGCSGPPTTISSCCSRTGSAAVTADRGSGGSVTPSRRRRRCSPISCSGPAQSGRTSGSPCCWLTAWIPNGAGSGHPSHRGRSAYEWAVRTGSTEIADSAARIRGARDRERPLDPVDELIAAALGGAALRVRESPPELQARARKRRPERWPTPSLCVDPRPYGSW